MSWFYSVPFLIVILLIVFLVLIWLRKVQHDAVHRNFLSIEEKFGGIVVRKSILSRPYYSGKIKGKELRVGFTSEKYKGTRGYYVHYTLECRAAVQGSIIQDEWYKSRDEKSKEDMQALLNGKYWLQLKGEVKKDFIKKLEIYLKSIPDFSYALIANTGIILERVTQNLVEDKEENINNKVISALIKIVTLFEKGGRK